MSHARDAPVLVSEFINTMQPKFTGELTPLEIHQPAGQDRRRSLHGRRVGRVPAEVRARAGQPVHEPRQGLPDQEGFRVGVHVLGRHRRHRLNERRDRYEEGKENERRTWRV